MRKKFRKIMCIILVISMMALDALQVFANGNNQTETLYVSDIKMAICDSLENAKNELYGYKVVESDLNKGMGNKAQSVYMGYKTTKNKDEAITDLRFMDMNGGYSYSDYDKALEEQLKAVIEEITSFIDAIKEFQENKKADKYNANYAYSKMNGFKDDDQNGKLLGDILADETVTAEKLQTIFLEGNSASVLALEEFLAIGCSDDWVERLSENVYEVYDSDAYVLEQYCEIIRKQWEFFRCGLSVYEEQLYSDNGFNILEATPETYNAWLETNPTDAERYYVNNFGTAYHILESYDYMGGTLLDYFMVPLEEVNYEYLYPIADAMTIGQLQTLRYVHLNKAVGYAKTDFELLSVILTDTEDNVKKTIVTTINSLIEDEDKKMSTKTGNSPVSIYEGVDRTLFNKDDGVALTNDALRKSSSSDDKSVVLQVLNNAKWYLTSSVVIGGIAIALSGYFLGAAKTALEVAKGAYIVTVEGFRNWLGTAAANYACDAVKVIGSGTGAVPEGYTTVMTSVGQQVAKDQAYSSILNSGFALGVAIGVTLIAIGFSLYAGYKKYRNPTYSVVPRAIVEQDTIDVFDSYNHKVGTKDIYMAYYPVKDASPDGTHGDYADMNAWKAKQWNVMYYTKDKRAGQPILADTFVVKYGKEVEKPEGYTPFCEFGLDVAADLNKHAFDNVDGVFLFYKTAEAEFTPPSIPEELASVFSNRYYALTAFAGVLIGAGCTLIIVNTLNKRKRKKDEPAEA